MQAFFSAMCGPHQNQQAHIPPWCSSIRKLVSYTLTTKHDHRNGWQLGYLAPGPRPWWRWGSPLCCSRFAGGFRCWIPAALCKFNQEFNNQRCQVYVDLLTPFFFIFFLKHSLMILTWHRFWLVSFVSYMFFMFISGESSMGFVELWWQEVSKLEKSPDLPSDQLGWPNDFWIDRRFPVLYLSKKKANHFEFVVWFSFPFRKGSFFWRIEGLKAYDVFGTQFVG